MPQFIGNIRELAKENHDSRREILTNQYSQIVLMSIEPGEDIGEETHEADQVLAFVKGEGEAILDGKKSPIEKGSMVAVPAGTRHNLVNTGDTPLKLYTIYSPPEEARTTMKNAPDATSPESDPRYHTANIKSMLDELIRHLRDDVAKVNEPKAQALFETSAEVLLGLHTAFEHYEENKEAGMQH